MSDYVFFDEKLCERFLALAAAHGLHGIATPDRIAGSVVTLPDNIDDELDELIEEQYELLMDEQRQQTEAADEDDRTLMGVDITLPDGSPCTVRLPPELARRLCETFSSEEIRTLATAIAADALDPHSGPLCRRR